MAIPRLVRCHHHLPWMMSRPPLGSRPGRGCWPRRTRRSPCALSYREEEDVRAARVLVVRRGVDAQRRDARVVILDPPLAAALDARVVPTVAARPVVRHDGTQLVRARRGGHRSGHRSGGHGLGGRRLVRRALGGGGGGGGRVAEAERQVE
eukprot:scaffold57324_cov66-Phaeocystis_antarctica.AAC.4